MQMKRSSPRLALLILLVLAFTLGLGFATLCAVLGGLAWPLELFSHYRPQLAGMALVVLILSLLLRHGPLILVNVVLLAANLVPIFPHLMSYLREPATVEAGGRSLRLLSLNMRADATNRERFAALIREENPDVILLTEMPPSIGSRMAPFEEIYPHRLLGRSGPEFFHEIGIFSRWPIASIQTTRVSQYRLPVIAADICPPSGERGACLHLITLHTLSPFGEGAAVRDQQLDVAARAAATQIGPTLMIGDLNITPWSPTFTRLIDSTRLKDSSRLRGVTPTWAPRSWSERVRGFTEALAPLAGLPIDHALASEDIALRASRVGPPVGSDHWPIIVDLQLPDLAAPRF